MRPSQTRTGPVSRRRPQGRRPGRKRRGRRRTSRRGWAGRKRASSGASGGSSRSCKAWFAAKSKVRANCAVPQGRLSTMHCVDFEARDTTMELAAGADRGTESEGACHGKGRLLRCGSAPKLALIAGACIVCVPTARGETVTMKNGMTLEGSLAPLLSIGGDPLKPATDVQRIVLIDNQLTRTFVGRNQVAEDRYAGADEHRTDQGRAARRDAWASDRQRGADLARRSIR